MNSRNYARSRTTGRSFINCGTRKRESAIAAAAFRRHFETVFLGSFLRELAVRSGLFFKLRLELGVIFLSGHLLEFNGHIDIFREHFQRARPLMALIDSRATFLE